MPYTSFIDSSYFVGEINIPNQTSSAVSVPLAQAITQYEKEILIQLLGYKLYSLLIADCSSGIPVTQKYIDLVNGAEFVMDDITIKWEGLKNTPKESLIAYYVFYKYVERNVSHLSGSGTSIKPSEKGWTNASSVNKMVNAWERMRTLYGVTPAEYKLCSSYKGEGYGDTFDYLPSAYNFLYINKADYPDWIFTPQWNINAFGI
jgi:hypothetical protein